VNTEYGVTELSASTGAYVSYLGEEQYGFSSADAVSSDGTHVWVANDGNSVVTEIDASTAALVAGVSDDISDPLAVSSDGTDVWVVNAGNTVAEISATTGKAIALLSSSAYVFSHPLAISADGTDVWVANSTGNSVTEIDAATRAIVRVI
jgi:DNA-binding beta-propeller fold protein YncE